MAASNKQDTRRMKDSQKDERPRSERIRGVVSETRSETKRAEDQRAKFPRLPRREHRLIIAAAAKKERERGRESQTLPERRLS